MDRKLPKDQEIQRLIRLSSVARSRLESEALVLKARLDVPARIRASLKNHPAGWLLGSLASGLAASLMLSRKAAVMQKTPRGLTRNLLGFTLNAVRPIAKVWLTNQVKNYLLRAQSRPSRTKIS